MALSWRQDQLYKDTFDLWAPNLGSGGVDPADTVMALTEQNVRGMLITKSSVDSVQDLGLLEGDDMISVDTISFDEVQEIDSSWVVVLTTVIESGENHPQWGKSWVIRGAPQRVIGTTLRPVGKTTAFAARQPRLPAEIKASGLYG